MMQIGILYLNTEVNYVEKIKEGKKLFKYQQLRKPCSVFIYFHEIFITNVALGENLSMSIDEYQLLLVDALSDYVL